MFDNNLKKIWRAKTFSKLRGSAKGTISFYGNTTKFRNHIRCRTLRIYKRTASAEIELKTQNSNQIKFGRIKVGHNLYRFLRFVL